MINYAQSHFTAYISEFSTDSQKVLYLVEKLTGHYRDWFSSHLIRNPGILQNYDLFVSSLLSFSGEDKELSTPSASRFAGLTQGLLLLGEYNWNLPSLQVFPLVNKTSTLTLLSFSDTSKSPTVLLTIHGPLGKIKVLALLDTGADANFIEEKLSNLIGLPASGSLDVKVGNRTLTGATPILQPVTIDLEGSPFCVTCNSSTNLSFLFILGFPWLREYLLNFDHPNNKISFTCNDIVK
ncbi:hypothetical protein DSO57_1006000 [Entomophthora muscae]|uniref:Uncharacterized protein n=1 Tax=Entomophthora muscae TaxID=34485 RepID=A0ACC2SKP9_9FUNG|nr:hypothetical protein DSO57_1006000 [Entomophthora muscae]